MLCGEQHLRCTAVVKDTVNLQRSCRESQKKKKKIKTLTLPPPFPQISCQCSPVSWSKVERVERMVGGGRVVDRKCTAHNLKETSKCNQVEFYR